MEEYTAKQVAEHNSPDDAWLIIHGQVYDVTTYLADHPGGADVLTEAAGTDASEDFDNAGHSEDAFEIMKDCCVGKIRGFEKKKPKLKPLAPVKEVKTQSEVPSSLSVLVTLGFIACTGAGAYYFCRRQGLMVPDWLVASLRSDSAGSSFLKGIVVGGGSLAIANAVAAKQFTTMAMKSKTFTSYPAHIKIPKRAEEDTLLQRGLLDPVTYSPLPLKQKVLIAPNVYRLTFSLPTTSTILGLPIGQHVTIKADMDGESVARSYTPVSNNSDLGVLELVIKSYPDGKLTSKYLAKLEVGDEVLFRGPKGAMKYRPNLCKKIGMIAGGTGITPMFQVIRAICEHDRDTTEISLIYANRTEQDILLREELDRFARRYTKNLKVYYMLDQPPADWKFGSGPTVLYQLAVAILRYGESHLTLTGKDQSYASTYVSKHQVFKAIATIIPSMTAFQDLQIIMICCLLFISFEGLTGRYDELLQHLSSGISLFKSPDAKVPFNNHDEASSALRHLDVLYDKKPSHYQSSDDLSQASLKNEATDKLQEALCQWTDRLDAFYAARKEDIAIEGEQQYRNLRLRQQYWQMAIDLHSTKEAAADPETFQPFLSEAKDAEAPLIALAQPTFSLDGDLVSGLAFVASTTTDDDAKVQALDLWWRLNRREGLLDSCDFVELHELARALQTCKEPKFDANWKPTAAAGLPTIIERL
ncbi:NADH cytb-reductase [Fusarium globosum]|uniref:NADH cytb-reductase n=1 Tax=Fusarium globosum TaxID=78864 RepID=A0A8H5YAC5_9HYPO|nr:NADH cytb-reductase [Fusarium globosum]